MVASTSGSYAGTEVCVQDQGPIGQGKSTQRARPCSPERFSQELIATNPGAQAQPGLSLSGSDTCSLPPTAHQAPCCSMPLLLPRESTVLSSQEKAKVWWKV